MDFSSLLSKVKRTAAEDAAQRSNGSNASTQIGSQRPIRHSNTSHTHQQSSRSNSHFPHHHNHNNSHKRQRMGERFNNHDMKRALANLPRTLTQPAMTANTDDQQSFHLAILFITIDELPYEHIWREWVGQAANDAATNTQISVLAQAKYPNKISSNWLQSKLLVKPPQVLRGTEYAPPTYHTRSPEWGSIDITRTMLDLIHEGLQVGVNAKNDDIRFSTDRYTLGDNAKPTRPVDAFVFASETCLPVVSLQKFLSIIRSTNNASSSWSSWVHYRNTPNNGYSRQLQFDKIRSCIPETQKHKADQWCLLSRSHASLLVNIDSHLPAPLWQCFLETKASDELYIPTTLSLAGVLSQAQQKRITYCDWSESAKNPATFSKGKEDLRRIVEKCRTEGCLLARKFSPMEPQSTERTGDMTVDDWKEIVMV